jgi:hypothetical protein
MKTIAAMPLLCVDSFNLAGYYFPFHLPQQKTSVEFPFSMPAKRTKNAAAVLAKRLRLYYRPTEKETGAVSGVQIKKWYCCQGFQPVKRGANVSDEPPELTGT